MEVARVSTRRSPRWRRADGPRVVKDLHPSMLTTLGSRQGMKWRCRGYHRGHAVIDRRGPRVVQTGTGPRRRRLCSSRPSDRAVRCRANSAADVRPACRSVHDSSVGTCPPGGHRPDGRRPRQPLPGALAQPARRPHRHRGRARAHRARSRVHGRRRADHRALRRPLPHDRRPQGARRVRVSRCTARHGAVRPDSAPGCLAIDRELCARRGGDQSHHGQPWRGGPSREHESGAVRVARALGHRSGGHRADAGLGIEREGDLRRVRRARG